MKVWLRPKQVNALRLACYETGTDYLQQRNEVMIELMYHNGVCVGER